ncbi:hypothetical protein UW163_01130 [Ralstonia solanacearum]|nr:hypothetical protein UW163_01130 [Ralstonia solanacearum]EUJ13994.1 hypothetical protein RSP673_13100 [Ralstonia solanacearum P673]OAI70903.1 hypothetical protein RSP797_13625 [Ralstonia solanacearum]
MSYQLHIERDTPIALNEWLEAIRARPELRAEESGSIAVNPVTGEEIAVPGSEGDASMLIEGRWVTTFRWNPRGISFKVPVEMSSTTGVMAVALDIASELSAFVRGDEGELYSTEG